MCLARAPLERQCSPYTAWARGREGRDPGLLAQQSVFSINGCVPTVPRPGQPAIWKSGKRAGNKPSHHLLVVELFSHGSQGARDTKRAGRKRTGVTCLPLLRTRQTASPERLGEPRIAPLASQLVVHSRELQGSLGRPPLHHSTAATGGGEPALQWHGSSVGLAVLRCWRERTRTRPPEPPFTHTQPGHGARRMRAC